MLTDGRDGFDVRLKLQTVLHTVKPLMFACPLFRQFCELNITVKLKGVYIDAILTLIVITRVLELCGLNLPKLKGSK